MIRKLASVLTCIAVCFSFMNVGRADASDIESFVTRLYEVCLGRTPDETGLREWSDRLTDGGATGTSVAYGFIFSSEFQNKDCTDEEYVEYMYNAFMGRPSDDQGKQMWVGCLQNGMSRSKLFEGFADSVEFTRICESYGIVRGNFFDGYDVDRVSGIDQFVGRLYQNILGRSPDTQGLRNWTYGLLNGEYTGARSAYGFFRSEEYLGRGKTNEEYVSDLYRTLLGREPDSTGITSWVDLLEQGYSRDRIFNGFVMSSEFGLICSRYGIDRGQEIGLTGSEYLTLTAAALDTDSVIFVEGTGGSDAVVTMLIKGRNGEWREEFSTNGYIGRNGLGKVREGDMRTPVGVYHFTDAFGLLDDPGCYMPYTRITDDLYWSGDPDYLYNRMVSINDHPDLLTSNSERLINYAPNYNYCLNISYNEEGTPGRGSALFLHCTGSNRYTGGCIAIPEEYMRIVMQSVRSDTLIVIDTRSNIQNLIYADENP